MKYKLITVMKKLSITAACFVIALTIVLIPTAHSHAFTVPSTCPIIGLNSLGSSPYYSNSHSPTISVSADINNPLSKVNYIDPNSGAQRVPVLAFDVNAGGTTGVFINKVVVSYFASGTAPTGLYLYSDGTQLNYQGVNSGSGTVTFSNISPSNQVTGHIFYIKADFPTTAANGSVFSASVNSVTTQYGSALTSTNQTVAGNIQTFYKATPQLTFQSATAVVNQTPSGTSSAVSATFNFSVTPKPGDEIYPRASDFTVVARGSNGANYLVASKGLTITGNNVNQSSGVLSANSTYGVSLAAIADGSILPASDTYTFYIISASTTVNDYIGYPTHIIQSFGLDNYHTAPVYFNRQTNATTSPTVAEGIDINNPQSKINYVDPNTGAQQTSLFAFNINSGPSGLPINKIVINYSASGTAPTGFYLFSDGVQESYQGAVSSNSVITFANLAQSSLLTTGNHVFTIKADLPASSINGTSITLGLSSISFSSPAFTVQNLTLISNPQFFYRATPQLTFQSASAVVNQSTITSTFNFSVTPKPGDELFPSAQDFTVIAQGSDGISHVLVSKALTISGNNVNQASGILPANSTYNITLSATANNSVLPKSDAYTFYLISASTVVKDYQGNQVHIVQTSGLLNFKTSPVYYTYGFSGGSVIQVTLLAPSNVLRNTAIKNASGANLIQAITNIINGTGYQAANAVSALRDLFDQLQATVNGK